MKKLILGAGALLLSSATFVGAAHAQTENSSLTPISAIYGNSAMWAIDPAVRSAAVDAGLAANPVWMSDMVGKGKSLDKPGSQMIGKPAWLAQTEGMSDGKPMALSAERVREKEMWLAQNGGDDMGAGKGDMMGQGGPFEAAAAGASTMWPACRPGPGDDNCIQTYERGVGRAYSQWSAVRSRMGVGGPDEMVTGKDAMAAASTDIVEAKPDAAAGPTTEPTGVMVQGKAALPMMGKSA